jgi:hypothetical protein
LSTHSPYVLEEVPYEGRIFVYRRDDAIEVIYGVTPEFALSKMDSQNRPEIYLFTEDAVASVLLTSLLREGGVDVSRIEPVEVGSASVVAALGQAAKRGNLPYVCVGVLDPDQDLSTGCIKLPGDQAPEKEVLVGVRKCAPKHLAQRLELSEGALTDALDRSCSSVDHKSWIKEAARLTSQTNDYFWETACRVWVKHCLSSEAIQTFSAQILEKLR